MEKSRLTDLSFVASDIMVLTFVSGRIENGVQKEYIPKDGDQIVTTPVLSTFTHTVMRDGEYYGVLVNGVGGRKLWQKERIVNQSFYSENFKDIVVAAEKGGCNLVKSIAWKCKPIDNTDPGINFVVEHHVTIYLTEKLQRNHAYYLNIETLGADCDERTFCFKPEALKSPAVHATQVGYRPDDAGKIGYLSYWNGEGGVEYDDVTFQVIDNETNQCVFEGKGRRAGGEEPFRLDNGDEITVHAPVWQLDFNALTRPGSYHLYVKDVGISWKFEIGRQVWQDAFKISMTGLLHHRSGIELDGTLTDYIRPRPYHPDDGKIYFQSTCSLMESGNGLNALGTDTSNFGNLVKGCTDKIVTNAWGGYFDACDWDRRIQHLYCSNMLMELYLMFPDYFNSLKLAVPESGNELPDIINECLYNLDFYLRLQMEDGAIRGGAEAEEHPLPGECGWQDSLKVMVYAPDHWSSYHYAATAALAARALKDHPRSKIYAESAVRAAAWALEEEKRAEDRPYTKHSRFAVQQAKNLMAAHLYALTGEEKYHDIFEATMSHLTPDSGFTYVNSSRPKRDQLVKEIMALLYKRADYGVEFSEKNAYNVVVCDPGRRTTAAGCLYSVPDIDNMLRIYYLTGDEKYLKVAVRALNVPNGANPLDLSYTTGVGTKDAYSVLHHDSRRTGQKTPSGITIYGNFNFNHVRPIDIPIQGVYAKDMVPGPLAYPSMESYLGIYLYAIQNEYTVMETICRTAYFWGFLAART